MKSKVRSSVADAKSKAIKQAKVKQAKAAKILAKPVVKEVPIEDDSGPFFSPVRQARQRCKGTGRQRKGPNEINELERRFLLEYRIDRNGTRAYVAAGGSPKGADSAASQMLARPQVKAALAKLDAADEAVPRFTRKLFLEYLTTVITYNIADLQCGTPYLVSDMRKLPWRLQQMVDSIKARQFYDRETGEIDRQELEIRMVPRQVGLDLIAKCRGWITLLSKTELNIPQAQVPWDQLANPPDNPVVMELIEGLAALEPIIGQPGFVKPAVELAQRAAAWLREYQQIRDDPIARRLAEVEGKLLNVEGNPSA